MTQNVYLYLIVAALTLYAIRALPMTLIRKDIKSPFIRSFLYYVPYVTLAVMTFPAILSATGSRFCGGASDRLYRREPVPGGDRGVYCGVCGGAVDIKEFIGAGRCQHKADHGN